MQKNTNYSDDLSLRLNESKDLKNIIINKVEILKQTVLELEDLI